MGQGRITGEQITELAKRYTFDDIVVRVMDNEVHFVNAQQDFIIPLETFRKVLSAYNYLIYRGSPDAVKYQTVTSAIDSGTWESEVPWVLD